MFERVVERHLRLEKEIFGEDYEHLFKGDQLIIRNILVKGAMGAYIDSFYFKRQIDEEEMRPVLLSLTFRVLGSKKKDILPLMKQLEEKKDVWIRLSKDVLK